MKDRKKKLRLLIKKNDIDGFLVVSAVNIRYLTGFKGSYGFLLLTGKDEYLFTDSRYYTEARKLIKGTKIRLAERAWPEILTRYGVKKLGFAENNLNFGLYRNWRRKIKGIRLIPLPDLTAEIRQVKDGQEINAIKKAVRVAQRALTGLTLRPGIEEREVKKQIEDSIREYPGAEPSFPTIVAFGGNSSMPHHHPGSNRLSGSQIVMIDLGARLDGYSSDLTRTYLAGKINSKFKVIYNVVLSAQKAAMEAIKPGVSIEKIDRLARDCITGNGFGRYFGHALGHGIGMLVHEKPAINYYNKQKLLPGMVFSVEPGIYIPGWGGVRIEDLVQVTANGCRILTDIPRELNAMIGRGRKR